MAVIALVGASTLSSTALACAGINVAGTASEVALVVWNQDTHEEQLIRRASFRTNDQGSRRDVGFVVPTPSRPRLEEIDNGVFQTLAHFVEEQRRPAAQAEEEAGGCGGSTPRSAGESNGPPLRGGSVTVLEESRIAGQDTTILQATDSEALVGWLQNQGFEPPSDFGDYLAPYVEAGWYLTAFRYPAEDDAARVDTNAVSMRFVSPAPFYPYRETAQREPQPDRNLVVFTLGSQAFAGQLGPDAGAEPWLGAQWSGELDTSTLARMPGSLGLSPGSVLTMFDDAASVRPSGHDVFFVADTRTTQRSHRYDAGWVVAAAASVFVVGRRRRTLR